MREKNRNMTEFFGWKRHPFSDTYLLPKPFLGQKERRIHAMATNLLDLGKSFAVTGPSGTGKSTLVQHLMEELDPNYYQKVYLHYGGLQRNGLIRALADTLGVDPAGRAVPVLTKVQKHIVKTASEHGGRHSVILIDDAQLMERASLLDLCSLMVNPGRKTVAASIILVGDHMLEKQLQMVVMHPVKTRLTSIFCLEPLDEQESEAFIRFRLESASAPKDLFEKEAIGLIAAHCRGNRRMMMNTATQLLNEALFRNEKTIGSQLVLGCDLMDISG